MNIEEKKPSYNITLYPTYMIHLKLLILQLFFAIEKSIDFSFLFQISFPYFPALFQMCSDIKGVQSQVKSNVHRQTPHLIHIDTHITPNLSV